jgi:hypothetical protein
MPKRTVAEPLPPNPGVKAPTSADFTGSCLTIHNSIIRIRDAGARSDASEFRTFDLHQYFLPPTPFSTEPISIASRPEIARALCNAAIELDSRMDPKAKSNGLRLASAMRDWAKFFEYGWRNGLYAMEDWTVQCCEILLTKLGKGGWSGALEIDDRTKELIATASLGELKSYVAKSKSLAYQYSLKRKFSRRIGTNCQSSELTPAKVRILRGLKLHGENKVGDESRLIRKRRQSFNEGMGQSHLRSVLGCLNILGEMKGGLGFVPFPDTVRLSDLYGVRGRRTANLDPDTVARLLVEAHWWLYQVGPPLTALLEEIRTAYAKSWWSKTPITPETVHSVLKKSGNAEKLEELFERRIGSIGLRQPGVDEISFKHIVYGASSACFVVIAFLNARRKDEIQNKKIGIHRNALKCFDATLDLYQCEVYIEKTYKTYVPFFVGSMTKDAIQAMERISDIARDLEKFMGVSPTKRSAEKEVKIFQIPRLLAHNGGGMQWFQFVATADKQAYYFVERALGEDIRLPIHPHTFRRAYALIFHYRYENARIQALSQQLGHLDLASTTIYISDRGVASGESEARAYGIHTREQIEANRKEIDLINAEIADVARERVRQLVEEVIANRPRHKTRGQFIRLVQRFHQRLGTRLDYSELDAEGKGKVLGDALIDRGHAFRPLPHVNCAVSPLRKSSSAGCYSKRMGVVAPENASPVTCTGCPYSHWVKEHNDAIEQDIERLATLVGGRCGDDSVVVRQARIDLKNLEAILKLRTDSLR